MAVAAERRTVARRWARMPDFLCPSIRKMEMFTELVRKRACFHIVRDQPKQKSAFLLSFENYFAIQSVQGLWLVNSGSVPIEVDNDGTGALS